MQSLPSKELAKPDLILPSTLAGHTGLAVENSTPHHLMIFLNGPVQCFVRLNPYRRGSVVVPDGHYVTAVVVTADEVVPLRAESDYRSEWQQTRYFIRSSDESDETAAQRAGDASGPWRLLWAPEPLGELSIDPESGVVVKATQ
jgi:hypothetical protein